MPQDIVKTTGPLKSTKPDVGGGASKNIPVFGIVKDNIDPTRSGRIKVLIGENSPQDSDNAGSWVTVSYMSNFFGKIDGGAGGNDNGTYKSNPSSYGEWHAPPDIGTKVICIFVNGDPNYGFYIGCVPEPETLHMVPAIGSSDKILANDGEAKSYGGATRLPVTNLNTNNKDMANSPEFNDSPRPVHSYTASIMNQQGIIRDPIRGPISSSASREAASRVGWGVSTPGRPIYEGGFDDSSIAKNLDGDKAKQLKVVARRGGHSIVMDDGDIIGRDQLVRIRTALGHQILMSDDGQTLMILHSNGQSYIELGKEGTVDIFSTNSFNVRTQGDINFHADRNINLHANENLNIQAKNIQTNSEEKTKIRAAGDINMAATGKITGLAGGAIAWGAGGDASLVGGGQAYVNGSKVNLNSGAPGTSPEAVSPIPLVAQTDTLFDEAKGFIASPGKLLSITSRAPAHAPWANAGQGVDLKSSMNAKDNLPASAAPATKSTNAAAQTTNPTPPATATVASAPAATPKVSSAIDKNTTAATVAATATNAATGPLAAATKQGAAIVETAQGKVAAVGAMAMTPAQMELGGALKPGAATLVNTLVQAGKTIEQALPTAVFSGVIEGAKNLTSMVENVASQATTLVNTMQKAQTALGAVGALTGKEAPTQIAGMVNAAATVGLGPVVDVVKTAAKDATNAVNSLTGAVTGVASEVTSVVNSVQNVATGATQAINSVNKAASSVTAGLQSATGAVNSLTGSLSGAVSGAVNGAVGQVTGQVNAIAGQATALAGQATALAGKATGALNQAQSALKAIGSGAAAAKLTETIGGLGGIQSALSAMGSVPSLSSLVNQAEGVASSAFNAIKDSFKELEANVPQNLTQIAKQAAAGAATVASTTGSQSLTGALNNVAGAAGNITKSLTGAVNSVAGAAGNVSGALNGALKGATGALTSVTGAVNGVTSTLSSVTGAVSGVTNTIASVNNSIASVSGAISQGSAALSNVVEAGTAVTKTINNVTAVASTLPNSVTSALNTTIGGVENAVNAVGAIAGAGPTIKNGLQALSNAASVVQQGAQAAVSSALASGLSNLPGGINTVASVTNNATGAVNEVPGTQALSVAISNATTSVMNGVSTATSAINALSSVAGEIGSVANSVNNITGSVTGAIGSVSGALNNVSGAVSGALGDATNALNKVGGAISGATGAINSAAGALNNVQGKLTSALGSVQGKLNSLTSLASAGLPVGAIAQLQSSIASLAGGIPNLIGLPAIGFNTTDRGSITAQIGAVLGDPGIPKPNLVGEITEDTKKSLEDAVTKTREEVKKLSAEFNAAIQENNTAKAAYYKARDASPTGDMDPKVMALSDKWNEAAKKMTEVGKKYLAALDASSAASNAQLDSKLSAINNASSPEAFLALVKKG